jgi:hypothetical protein
MINHQRGELMQSLVRLLLGKQSLALRVPMRLPVTLFSPSSYRLDELVVRYGKTRLPTNVFGIDDGEN